MNVEGWTIRKEWYADGPSMFEWIAEAPGEREEFPRRRDAIAHARQHPVESCDASLNDAASISAMTNTNLIVRETVGGTAHLADADTRLPICGTNPTKHTVTVRPVNVEAYITCSKCRKLQGWKTLPGSFRERTTSGLDSSAWGINRGR